MKYLKILLIFILLFPTIVKGEDLKLAEGAKSAVLLETSTGEIIFEKNANERQSPASMTKMMTMLLVMEAIEAGVLAWDDSVTASTNASSMGGSQILLEANEQMSVKDLFKGVAIASGNDAAVALAEKIGGSESNFVTMMNRKVKELGLINTNFKNVHGLDEENHYSTAYDMAMIAKELVKHEKVLEYSKIYEDYLRKGTPRELWLVNTNKLVRFYEGVDGLKTGYTNTAGYCLTATVKKNNMRLIAVVMGEADSQTRNKDITEMFNYTYAQYELQTLLSKNDSVKEVTLEDAKEEKIKIVLKDDVTLLNRKMGTKLKTNYELDVFPIKAPLKKGDIVGNLYLKSEGNIVRTIPLTIEKDIKKANFFELYVRYLKNIIGGNINF